MAEREMTAVEMSEVRVWNSIWTGLTASQRGDCPEQWSVRGTPAEAVAELNRRLPVGCTLHRIVYDGEWDIRVRMADTGAVVTVLTTL